MTQGKVAGILVSAMLLAACGGGEKAEDEIEEGEVIAVIPEEVEELDPEIAGLSAAPTPVVAEVPDMNARRGRILFTVKGCVICHQVNGVGGRAAPDLSRSVQPQTVNPLDFTARMWRGATAMTQLQEIELGYTIELDAQDFADLAAFAESPEEQALFTLDSVGAEMRTWFLDDRYWLTGDWERYKERGTRIPTIESEVD